MQDINRNDPNLLIMKIEARNRLAEQIKDLEQRKKAQDEEIIAALFEQGQTTMQTAHWGASIQNRTTKTIKAERLIAQGVDPDIVDRATDVSISDPFLVVRAKKTGDMAMTESGGDS